MADTADSSLVDQLESLYEEKDQLNQELGVSDPEEVIEMVRSLKEQLETFYAEQDETN